jgi:hypothetical protein
MTKRFKSVASYMWFGEEVRAERRYFRSKQTDLFLQAVLATGATRELNLSKGTALWRAQVGHAWRIDKKSSTPSLQIVLPAPFPAKRMLPLPDRALENRANPKGIPYPYMATDKETAMSETRPWPGATLTVAQFKTVRDLKLIDCSKDVGALHPFAYHGTNPTSGERERVVWCQINEGFSRPVERSDHVADYVPTQILAELFKDNGYDGLKYRSSISSVGTNIVLFDPKTVKVFSRRLFTVKSINFQFR